MMRPSKLLPLRNTHVVFDLLVAHFGKPVSVEIIAARLYGAKRPKHYRAAIRVLIQRLRAILVETDADIWCRGYAYALEHDEPGTRPDPQNRDLYGLFGLPAPTHREVA